VVTNPDWKYVATEAKYQKAKTISEKIEALREMIAVAPSHKSAENLQLMLKQRLAKLIEEEKKQKKKKAKPKSILVKKEGFQIVIIGFPNTGKSTLLKTLTNANPEIADYPFTTKEPEIGIMNYDGAAVQMVEIPALISGAAEKQANLMSIVANANGIILLFDDEEQKRTLLSELAKFKINKQIFFCTKENFPSKKQIFEFFKLIRIYTKDPGCKTSAEKPIVMRAGATVMDVALKIHKDFAERFSYARVWGSSKFPGQRVEKNYVLHDGDIVEFHLR